MAADSPSGTPPVWAFTAPATDWLSSNRSPVRQEPTLRVEEGQARGGGSVLLRDGLPPALPPPLPECHLPGAHTPQRPANPEHGAFEHFLLQCDPGAGTVAR